MSQDNEPWTFARVRHRLNTLIEVMPKRASEITSDQLLPNIWSDLVELRAAVDQLERQGGRHG
jgi:hypothetical protein